MRILRYLAQVKQLTPMEFDRRILVPIMKADPALSMITFGSLEFSSSKEIEEVRAKILEQGFELYSNEDEDVLAFVLASAARAAELSRPCSDKEDDVLSSFLASTEKATILSLPN